MSATPGKWFWTVDGKIIVDQEGRPILCDRCPCTDYDFCIIPCGLHAEDEAGNPSLSLWAETPQTIELAFVPDGENVRVELWVRGYNWPDIRQAFYGAMFSGTFAAPIVCNREFDWGDLTLTDPGPGFPHFCDFSEAEVRIRPIGTDLMEGAISIFNTSADNVPPNPCGGVCSDDDDLPQVFEVEFRGVAMPDVSQECCLEYNNLVFRLNRCSIAEGPHTEDDSSDVGAYACSWRLSACWHTCALCRTDQPILPPENLLVTVNGITPAGGLGSCADCADFNRSYILQRFCSSYNQGCFYLAEVPENICGFDYVFMTVDYTIQDDTIYAVAQIFFGHTEFLQHMILTLTTTQAIVLEEIPIDCSTIDWEFSSLLGHFPIGGGPCAVASVNVRIQAL